MNLDQLRGYFLPKASAPAPTMPPVQPGIGIPTDAVDAAVPAQALIDDPNGIPPGEIQMYGDSRDLAPAPAEIEMPNEYVGRGPDPTLQAAASGPVTSTSQVAPPAPSVIPSSGGTANQAAQTGAPSEGPVASPSEAPLGQRFRHAPEGQAAPTQDTPAPSDPTQTATWARGVEDTQATEDQRIQNEATTRGVTQAEKIASIASQQLAAQMTAQKAVEDRVSAIQRAQDVARGELARRSDVLARAAEQKLNQRPGASTRAAGRAMLAIGAGMGSQSAANLYEARMADEERNERNDIERRNSDIAALARSHGAGLENFQALMASAQGEQQLANAQQLAREKLGIKELETEVLKLSPGDKQLQGQALISEQKRKHADNVIKLASEQVKQQAEWMQLHPVAVGKVPGAPPAPPDRPIRKQDESDESFNQRYDHWQSAEMPYYEGVALPQWKAKLGAAGTTTAKAASGARAGSPMAQWEGRASAIKGTAPADGGVTSAPAAVSGKAARPAKSGKAAAKPTAATTGTTTSAMLKAAKDYFLRGGAGAGKAAPAPTSATAASEGPVTSTAESPADLENKRLRGIPLPGSDEVIAPKRGMVPNIADEEGKKLPERVAASISFHDKMRDLATLVADPQGQGLSDYLSTHAPPGIDIASTAQGVREAIRPIIMFELSKMQDQGVIRESEQKLYEKMVPDVKVLGANPEKAMLAIKAVTSTFTEKTANSLDAHRYDSRSYKGLINAKDKELLGLGVRAPKSSDDAKAANAELADEQKAESKQTERLARTGGLAPIEVRTDPKGRPVIKAPAMTAEDLKADQERSLAEDGMGNQTLGKVGRFFFGVSDSEANPPPYAESYSALAKQQIELNGVMSKYQAALKAKDYKQAQRQWSAIEQTQNQQIDTAARIARRLRLEDPPREDLYLKYVPKDVVSMGGNIRRDAPSLQIGVRDATYADLRPFIKALIESDGALLKGGK